MKIYCVKCKGKTDSEDLKEVRTKNGKRMVKGVCTSCGCKKGRFVAEKASIGISGGCFTCDSSSS